VVPDAPFELCCLSHVVLCVYVGMVSSRPYGVMSPRRRHANHALSMLVLGVHIRPFQQQADGIAAARKAPRTRGPSLMCRWHYPLHFSSRRERIVVARTPLPLRRVVRRCLLLPLLRLLQHGANGGRISRAAASIRRVSVGALWRSPSTLPVRLDFRSSPPQRLAGVAG